MTQRLRIPEIVPFRLTRNIIDGMGPVGVEGTFTKAAERTLFALKENSNSLLTILSAIVSDPLYKWSTGSRKEAHKITVNQDHDEDCNENQFSDGAKNRDENRNEVASHAISRIHEKLLGYEDGTSGEQQSVESQVQLLMNEAQDPDNLCAMFVGWAPFQ
jgi:serine-protein kinase ATM